MLFHKESPCLQVSGYNKIYSTTNNYSIKNFTIYGERHCGTKWISQTMQLRFNLTYINDYGHKHFFGCCDWKVLNQAHNTLFIAVVRNIYAWIKGMIKIPYHLPSKNILDIKPWQSIGNNDISFCDSHWYTKEFYSDIFDMRYNKNLFLHQYMPYLVDNFVFIRYEDFISHHEDIIEAISDIYHLKQTFRKTAGDLSKLSLQKLPQNYLEIINTKNNWNQEHILGYKKVNSLPTKEKLSYLITDC
jgi:hypothetical protein